MLLVNCSLILLVAVLVQGQIQFPDYGGQGNRQRQCDGIPYMKITPHQRTSPFVQYEQFATNVSQLDEISTCFWMMVDDPLRPATMLNYAMDERVNNDNITLQYRGSESLWTLVINGQNVYRSKARRLQARKWTHFCHSWSGKTGEWSVWQNGNLIESDVNQQSRGWKIPAGGVLVTCQHQNTIQNNGGRDNGEGLEGSLTLMSVSDKHLSTDSISRRYVDHVSKDCSPRARGEIADWLNTPRLRFGGVRSSRAQAVCGNF
ncbi:hypothetical protein HAZT_HAZT007612 [Hyalella azteca]|uniref:Pentraxin-related protein PTX3-like n=1 Tax=Hyalella azteca TaxID=294128 RepID=A0A6A0GSA3_HYAAZ|nr:pentraxin-related protein PTX3-like [Hyalella azteca]KAA0186466.1 hypothetical protein HAZT_HAZT007612 [Hyalella azteca]